MLCLLRRLLHWLDLGAAMINAVLVFNNSGQPRLTKFYTQLVRILSVMSKAHADVRFIGHSSATASHL